MAANVSYIPTIIHSMSAPGAPSDNPFPMDEVMKEDLKHAEVPPAPTEDDAPHEGRLENSESNEVNPWHKCAELSAEFDEKYGESVKNELDNLLVFAALFSSILTSFVVESYSWIQPGASGSPVPYKYAVIINCLWFASLAMSLGVSSAGILCMQWIRTYSRLALKPTKGAIILRRQRFQGLIEWQVPDIIGILPVLLQLSLLSFVIGITYLLWVLSTPVAVLFSFFVAIFFAFYFFTTVAPVVQWWIHRIRAQAWSQCPYQSPQVWALFIATWWVSQLHQWLWHPEGRKNTPLGQFRWRSRSDNPGNWRTFDLTWWERARDRVLKEEEQPAVEAYLADEFEWQEAHFSHDVEGIRCRALVLGEIPALRRRNLVLSAFRNLDLRKITPQRRQKFDSSFPPEGELDLALWQAWYFAAHAHTHPVLDADCMEAKIRYITHQKANDSMLPYIPRRDGLNITYLSKDPQLLPRFIGCLRDIVEGQQFSTHAGAQDTQEEIWALICSLLQHAIQENTHPGFDHLKGLLESFYQRLSPFASHPSGSEIDLHGVATRMLEGLAPFIELYGKGHIPSLPPYRAEQLKPLLSLVALLEGRIHALAPRLNVLKAAVMRLLNLDNKKFASAAGRTRAVSHVNTIPPFASSNTRPSGTSTNKKRHLTNAS